MDNEVLIGGNSSFMSYMFSLAEGEKIELLNMFQYILIAIIPILILFKLMNTYLPIVDKGKSTIEITVEVVIQVIILFALLFFIHKIILYIPTYTKQAYPSIQFFSVILPVLFILFSLDKKMNEKVSIIWGRVMVMIGITKENFDDSGSDLKENEKGQHQTTINATPQMSGGSYVVAPQSQYSNPGTISHDQQIYEQPTRKSDQQQPQQYGIPYMNEPMAANEIGFSSF